MLKYYLKFESARCQIMVAVVGARHMGGYAGDVSGVDVVKTCPLSVCRFADLLVEA